MARHCVGVLALQGAFREHCIALEACGAQALPVRKPQDFMQVHALIIPGGESTTMGKLLHEWDLFEPIRQQGHAGMPIYGSCAGLILLCNTIDGYPEQKCFGLLNASVQRNAFGRQKDSFETPLHIPVLGARPVHAVFIRAPIITRTGPEVDILARINNNIVAVQHNNILATSFHPELTKDRRIHEYFLKML
ncbi:MAG: pyridoxal 5'-phosphate synthase glutaminase subunit PdxT [Desulfovibrionaceae bacterium]